MRKILLVFVTLMLVSSLIITGCPAPPPEQITLDYAFFAPHGTFPAVQMERWAGEVNKRTDGLVTVNTYPGGTLLGVKDMYDGIMAGVADIGCVSPSYFAGRFPLLSVVDLDHGWDNAAQATYVLWKLTEKYQPESLAGMKVITMFATTPADVITIEAVRCLEDLKGKELRASAMGAKILEVLGATPVAMPMTEVPEALAKRIIVGYFTSTETLWGFKTAEICKYSTNTKLGQTAFSVTMNRDSWNALPPAVQRVIDDLSFEIALWTGQYVDMHSAEALTWAAGEYGLEEIFLSPEEKARWHARTKPLIDEWLEQATAKGLPAQQILDDVYKWKAEAEGIYGTELMPTGEFVDELYRNRAEYEEKYGMTFLLEK